MDLLDGLCLCEMVATTISSPTRLLSYPHISPSHAGISFSWIWLRIRISRIDVTFLPFILVHGSITPLSHSYPFHPLTVILSTYPIILAPAFHTYSIIADEKKELKSYYRPCLSRTITSFPTRPSHVLILHPSGPATHIHPTISPSILFHQLAREQ